MPSMELQSSSLNFYSLSREQSIDKFQIQVAESFANLSSAGENDLLSLLWIRNLLEAFLKCQKQFRFILFNNRHLFSRSPMDRLISDFFDRSIKALDVCNAIRDGIEQVRQCGKQMEIVLVALDPRQSSISQGRIRRAEKALIDLALFVHDDKESSTLLVLRNRKSTSVSQIAKDHPKQTISLPYGAAVHLRSSSLSVYKSWSAAKQLQAIGNNIYVPKSQEVVATNGLANSIFTMNSLLHFVMWVLVAAIPCQDRGGLQSHFPILKSFSWGASVVSLHERIMEESKKKERKKSVGLLKEIHQLEQCTPRLLQLIESVDKLLEKKEVEMIRQVVLELGDVYNSLMEDLEPLQRQVRDVFHEIVRCRIEGLDCLHKPE